MKNHNTEVPMIKISMQEVLGRVSQRPKCSNCKELMMTLEKVQSALNSVLKYSHGDDLVDLHDECFYANIEINNIWKKMKG